MALEAFMISHSVALIVVDSIASLVRREFGSMEMHDRLDVLTRKVQRLKCALMVACSYNRWLAETFQVPVRLKDHHE
jgi:RecA/RadA recombinase